MGKIFDKAVFGKCYQLRDGRLCVFIKKDDQSDDVLVKFGDGTEAYYHSNGVSSVRGSSYYLGNSNDIVGEVDINRLPPMRESYVIIFDKHSKRKFGFHINFKTHKTSDGVCVFEFSVGRFRARVIKGEIVYCAYDSEPIPIESMINYKPKINA